MNLKTRLTLTLLTACGILGGCETMPEHMSLTDRVALDVGLREAHVEKVQWNNTRFILNAEVTLLDKNAATLESADYVLKVGDATIATGSTHVKVSLVPGQPAVVGFPIEINYNRFVDAVKQRKDLITPSGDVSATLTGKITAHGRYSQLMMAAETTPFESAVAIPLKQEIWYGTGPASPK